MPFFLNSIGLALAYLISAKIGLTFGTVSGSVTIFWPASGIALAALLLGGLRYLPAIFVGAYLASVMVNAPLIFGMGAAIGNTLEPYIGYTLLNRYGNKEKPDLDHIRGLFKIVILGGLVPAIASATLGPFTLLVSGLINTESLPDVMWRWWRADVLGIAFFTPLILSFIPKRPFFLNAARFWEILVLWAFAIVIGQMIFLAWAPVGFIKYPLGLAWVFPVLIWSALRTGRRNTLLIQLLFLIQALGSAYLKMGIFADEFARYGLSNFWMFAMLMAVVGKGFTITAAAERHAARKNAQNAKLFDVSSDAVMIVDAESYIVSVNNAFTDITGYSAEEVIGMQLSQLSPDKQESELNKAMWESHLVGGQWEGEIWNHRKDGTAYLERLNIHTITDSSNKIINSVFVFSDITQQKASLDAFKHQAQHDFLTNLPNRLLFCDRFNQQLAFAIRHKAKFAVIYLDLDQFKPVNDKLGHLVGDQLLMAVADRLSSLVREIDTVSRFGGDEFAILVSEVEQVADVVTLANKILSALSEPFIVNRHTVKVSGSLGIALYPDHGEDLDTILSNADAAMYQAKQLGSNACVIATIN